MTLSVNWCFRIVLSLLIGLAVAFAFRREWRYEQQVAQTGCTAREGKKRDTVIWLSPWVLPILMAALWAGLPAVFRPRRRDCHPGGVLPAADGAAHPVFWGADGPAPTAAENHLRPGLRHLVAASGFVYYGQYVFRGYVPPLVVLRVPHALASLLPWLWMFGFGAVLLWHLISHFRFRRMILKEARLVGNQKVNDLWWEEERLVLLKRHIPLLTSPAISSPLTIGLFNKTMRTVLPQRSYTLDQYRLIFRHELHHVQRRDVDTKCFYIFCKALCWFNPLVWIALKKASADLELSCDEMVVCGSGDKTRQEYAFLLLETAGDERGFTTCLSASAKGLRHRLQGVVKPQKRSSGTFVLGAIMVVLMLCSGFLSVSSTYGTIEEVLLAPYGTVTVDSVSLQTDDVDLYRADLSPQVREELLDYLSALPIDNQTGHWTGSAQR